MTSLRSRDLRRALAFALHSERECGVEPLPAPALDALRELVPSTAVSWHEWCVDTGRVRFAVSSEDPDRTVSVWEEYPRYRREDPLPGGCEGVGPCLPPFVDRTLRVSDVQGTRAFRRSGLYGAICRPLGVDHVMKLFLPVERGMARSVVFDRSGRDFGERDRLVVDLLRPHFVHLVRVARARRLAAALAAGAEEHGELVVVNPAGWVEFATVPGRRLMNGYGVVPPDGRVGSAVRDRLLTPAGGSLTIDVGRRVLVVRPLDGHPGALVLREHPASESLTSRELQVMALVGEGLSNAQVAAHLWIAPGTVRKHLENVYAKLGVRSRTAALARLRELDSSGR